MKAARSIARERITGSLLLSLYKTKMEYSFIVVMLVMLMAIDNAGESGKRVFKQLTRQSLRGEVDAGWRCQNFL
jgi:hypothetical protein